ncbi:hypothetical protein GALMADRAFT_919388 [Galerina marginata CBS 339.88]|uniref:Uncharacterized protein n=1 Tax=Galerina marginata (strain CBS 339.88) TaxID=685588 RepID=A0A067SEP1_GALM3|nr:hypothetical protein GALMADRAFT_919388 [Galerina marginata CBS 339.88]
MTEYDYSPEAYERHLAKQAKIADWVEHTNYHEPANPFVPMPGEHAPSETYSPPPQPYQPTPQYPYQFQQPQPAFYTTPQGVISPTYSSSKRHHHHKHKHHSSSSRHASGSQSLRPSPQTATSALPMGTGLSYAPTPQRSASTPPSMTVRGANGMIVPVTMTTPQSYFGYPAQQHQFFQPQAFGYPTPYVTSPPAMAPTYSRTSSHSHSRSRPSSSRRSSRSTDHSYQLHSPPLQSSPYGQVYQPSSNQPVVVPINGGAGGYVVVPAGQNVQVIR